MLLVELYDIGQGYGTMMCDECVYPPAWRIRPQLDDGGSPGYACTEHVDTVMNRIHYKLPGGPSHPPA